jgi:hypothetical protein
LVSGNTDKILIGKKVIGINLIILSYKWHYMKNADINNIIYYFWNIFKTELINWYENNKGDIINNDENDDEPIFKSLYNKYYKNVILISENIIIREIKDFIIKTNYKIDL